MAFGSMIFKVNNRHIYINDLVMGIMFESRSQTLKTAYKIIKSFESWIGAIITGLL